MLRLPVSPPDVLQELSASSQAVGNAAAPVVALQVMDAAVSEFSLVTASPIGLSWEYHESCRNMFEVSNQAGPTAQTAAARVYLISSNCSGTPLTSSWH